MRRLAYPAQDMTVRRWGFMILVRSGLFIAILAAVLCGLLACAEQFSGAEDALGDTAERIEQSVLPPIIEESEAVVRNFVNLLPVLLEICATPVGKLGEFTSQLPELQRAQQQVGDTFTVDDSNGSWQVAWRDVIFGDQDGQLSADAGTPSVDVILSARFRNAGLASVRAVPFVLPARQFVETDRDSGDLHTCTNETETPEGYYLFQDRTTGVWTLGWCAQGTDKVFEGEITAIGISRVSRKVSSEATEEVGSLSVNTSSTTLQFEETTAPMVAEGIRFFVRPGELLDFALRMGPVGSDPSNITRRELRLGAERQFLPEELELNPADFQLTTSVPIVPTGEPNVQVQDFATFVWQDEMPGPCTQAGETLWHVRFQTAASALFSGFVALADEDASAPRLRVLRVGSCQQGRFEFEDDNERLRYDCVVNNNAGESGYDVCVSGARRLQFSPEVEEVGDPTRVWIGSENARPPSQDPFSMFYEVAIQEGPSAQELELTNGRIALQSTTEEGGTVRLRDDQVSLEALCRPLDDGPVHVRLVGNGEYATERFEGSRYEFEELDFTDGLRTGDVSARRLPDRGEIELRTRDEDDTVEITVPASELADTNGRVTGSIDITLTLDTLELDFLDRTINLSLE